MLLYTAISKKIVIVHSLHWNRKELWGSRSTNTEFINVSIDFAKCIRMQVHHIMPRQYSNNLRRRIITHYDCTQSSFRFQYQLLTATTFFKPEVTNISEMLPGIVLVLKNISAR